MSEFTIDIKYSGKECHKCGKLIELELETPSSNPYFKDDPLEWVEKHHDCIVHLKEEIEDLRGKIDSLEDEISQVRYLADPDDRRFH